MREACPGEQKLIHALDMMIVHDWENAKAALDDLHDPISGRLYMLVAECKRQEVRRQRRSALLRHEMGNALSVALANVEGIIDGIVPNESVRWEGIGEALRSVAAMLDRWRRGPDAEPAETVRIETFDICALVTAQYATISGLAEAKNVRVGFQPCGSQHERCSTFRGDPVAIGQILRNVLINAVRYTPPGGNVELACDWPGDRLQITIRDSGPGIPPQDAPHIFEEGYRSPATAKQGSGLGLSVVATLLRELGGSARVVDEQGGGTTFSIELPAAAVLP